MGIEQIFFTIVVVVSFWLTPKLGFVKNSHLSSLEIRVLLAFKLLVALVSAWYILNFSTNIDYFSTSREGKVQYQLLLDDPWLFFTDFNTDAEIYGYGGLFDSKDSFWAYLRFNVLYKITGIINLITKGNFYMNTVIFSTLVFFSHLAFYRVYSAIYPNKKKLVLIACFALPSLMLYTSCIHKDGMVFLCLGLLGYSFNRLLLHNFHIKYFLAISIAAMLIFLFRNYVVVALMPAMLLAVLCQLFPSRKWLVVLGTYIVFGIVFFGSVLFSSSFNLPAAVVQRKTDFAILEGGRTNIEMNELAPDVSSFVVNLPQALNHAVLRPYIWEFPKASVILTAIELVCYQVLILCFLIFRDKQIQNSSNFNIFGLALFFNMMLIIGYTIPNIGAIVRYRSIFWIFLLTPVICNINFQRITRYFRPATT